MGHGVKRDGRSGETGSEVRRQRSVVRFIGGSGFQPRSYDFNDFSGFNDYRLQLIIEFWLLTTCYWIL